MIDKELLELAAKSAGYLDTASVQDGYGFIALRVMNETGDWTGKDWNPLTDDGDALRLAVKLKLTVLSNETASWIAHGTGQLNIAEELHNNDPYASTRRAIVRAAAEIGASK